MTCSPSVSWSATNRIASADFSSSGPPTPCSRSRIWGPWFRVGGKGNKIRPPLALRRPAQASGFGVWGAGLRGLGPGFRIGGQGVGTRVISISHPAKPCGSSRASGLVVKLHASKFRVHGLGRRVWGEANFSSSRPVESSYTSM